MKMALTFPSNSTAMLTPSCHYNHLNTCSNFNFYTRFSPNLNPAFRFNLLFSKRFSNLTSISTFIVPIQSPPKSVKFTCRDGINENPSFENTFDLDFGDLGVEDLESPWEGAVIYKRNPSILHLEYCTTLERLGFGELSTDISKSRASTMGLRVTKSVKDYPLGTPVQISIDVTRKKHRLRLDGVIKTVLTLSCNRYFFFFLYIFLSIF